MENPTLRDLVLRSLILTTTSFLLPLSLTAQSDESGSSTDDSDIVTLDPFSVTSEGDRGYGSTHTVGGTRINTALEDAPISVISLNSEVIADINPRELEDALRFASGVTNVTSGISVRGIVADVFGYRDGIADPQGGFQGNKEDPLLTERLEVVKGPNGVLYGSHSLGGLINRIGKRPESEQRTEIGFEFGSDSWIRGELDSTGPLGSDNKLLYRFIAAYQDGEIWTGGPDDRWVIAPMLTYNPNEKTSLWTRFTIQETTVSTATNPWFADANGEPPFGIIPVDNNNSNPGHDEGGQDVWSLELGWQQGFEMFGADWTSRVVFRHNERESLRNVWLGFGGYFFKDGVGLQLDPAGAACNPPSASNCLYTRRVTTWDEARAAGFDDIVMRSLRRDLRFDDIESYNITFDLTSTFDTGGINHTFLTYAGTGESENNIFRTRRNWDLEDRSVFDMVSRPPSEVLTSSPETRNGEWATTDSEGWHWAIQDNLSFLENRVNLVGGARFTHGRRQVFNHCELQEGSSRSCIVDGANADGVPSPKFSSGRGAFSEAQVNEDWTFNYGIVIKPVDGVSIYYNKGETFVPGGGRNLADQIVPSLTGESDEIGVKFGLFNGRVVSTIAYYDMLLENRPVITITDDGDIIETFVPENATSGWDFDVAVQPTDSLSFLFAFQDIESLAKSSGNPQGIGQRGVPQGVTYKAIAKYSFLEGPLGGFSAGINYENVDGLRAGDGGDTFRLPGYDVYGLFFSYKQEHWRVHATIENAGDTEYVRESVSTEFVRPGPGIRFRLKFSYFF